MKIIEKKLSDLKPAPYNPRTISEEALVGLENSLARWGVVQPIIWNKQTGYVVGGHQRIKALQKIGTTKTKVVVVDLNETEEKALNVSLNNQAISGDWTIGLAEILKELEKSLTDQEMIDLQIKALEKEIPEVEIPEETTEGNTDPDEVPEDAPTRCKLGDLWQLGDHRLLCGDSTDRAQVERLMGGEKADMVFTDPPYNIGFKPQRGTHDIIMNDDMGNPEFEVFLRGVFNNCNSVLKDNAVLISFMGWSTVAEFQMVLRELFEIKSMPIWVKNNFGIGYFTLPKYEPSFLCLKGKPEKPEKAPADVFECAKVYKTIHSCEKPIDLILEMIGPFSKSGQLFFEPFGGSGSTLIACEKTKRKCRMMELDPKYCDVILKRWEDFTGKEAVRIES